MWRFCRKSKEHSLKSELPTRNPSPYQLDIRNLELKLDSLDSSLTQRLEQMTSVIRSASRWGTFLAIVTVLMLALQNRNLENQIGEQKKQVKQQAEQLELQKSDIETVRRAQWLTTVYEPKASCNEAELGEAVTEAEAQGALKTSESECSAPVGWEERSTGCPPKAVLRVRQEAVRALLHEKKSKPSLAGASLGKATFVGANFRQADFAEAGLAEADFRGAELGKSILQGADLRRAVFEKAIFVEADLKGSALTGTNLNRADLSGADLSLAFGKGISMEGADLTDATIRGAVLCDSNLGSAQFSGADLYYSVMRRSDLSAANLRAKTLDGIDLTDADLAGAKLEGTPVRNSILRGAHLEHAELVDSNLSGADLSGAVLSFADLQGANLQGAKLYGTDLEQAENLERSQIQGTCGDSETTLPPHLQPSPPAHWLKRPWNEKDTIENGCP